MKLSKYKFCFFVLAAMAMTGCKGTDVDNEHHYDNRLYISSQPVCDDLLIKAMSEDVSRAVSYRIASPVEKDIHINFEAAPALTAAYNLAYGDNASALQEEFYDIPQKEAVIKTGAVSSQDIVVNFKNIGNLDRKRRYVLPITIADASNIDVLESRRTAYFIFKGAALVNVVADLSEKSRFRVGQWNNKSAMEDLSKLTAEVLLRPHELETAGKEISTIMGVEDKFLIRIGDAGVPKNQIQLAFSGGKVTDSSWKINKLHEWIHVALTFDSENGEVELYLDGVKKGDTKKISYTRPVNWGVNDFWIGYSYAAGREFDGDICECRVWNRILSAEEIQATDHFYSVAPDSDGLVAYWKFDEGGGEDIKDYTANGNDLITFPSGTLKWVNVELPAMK